MKVKVLAVSSKNKAFKGHNGKWYEYNNISSVQKGKWYEITVDKDGKTVLSLKESVYTPSAKNNQSQSVLSDEQFESVKKYLSKKLFLDLSGLAFKMAKEVADKYYEGKSKEEYAQFLLDETIYFSKALINYVGGVIENIDRDNEKEH